jgi:signal transduction histidine kinase/DNA-binding NarL/FixJ family response regulator
MSIPTTKILLIEDDEEDFILLKKHLARIARVRYEIIWENSYEVGLQRLLEVPHDLCFLDYQLGERNGIELIAEARKQGYAFPIVLLTGASGPDLDIQALQVGADDYIDKRHLQGELLHRVIRYAIERRKAEQEREKFRLLAALEFERARFEEVLQNLPSGVLMAEAPGGKIVFGNPQVETILRHPVLYSPNVAAYGEWVAWHLDGRLIEPDEWLLARAIRGEHASEEVKYQRGDGTICFIRINGAPVKDPNGIIIAGVVSFNDITEQKELEHQQEVFISMATHELKTPLTALRGNLQLAQRRLHRLMHPPEPPTGSELQKPLEEVLVLLDRGEQQVRIQNRLINDLLEMSRIQTDNIEMNPINCDLLELVEEIIQDFQMAHPQRSIVLEPPEHADIVVVADPDRVRQVLSNYITNALKYAPAAAPIQVGLRRNGEQVRVWVRDQGPGLSAEAKQFIWKRFYQVPTIHVQNGSGVSLGLGLYISQRLVYHLGGQVGVESRIGEGSTFWFTLPIAQV